MNNVDGKVRGDSVSGIGSSKVPLGGGKNAALSVNYLSAV